MALLCAALCGGVARSETAGGAGTCGPALARPQVTVGPRYGVVRVPPVPNALVERIEKALGETFQPAFFWGVWGPTEFQVPAQYWRGRLSLFYSDVLVGQGSAYVHGDLLRFDIWIDEAFRRGGLYGYLFDEMLRAFPKTRRIPTRMNAADSENATTFLDTVFGTVDAFAQWKPHDQTPAERAALYRRIVAALPAMPAVKTRMRFGFGRVTKLVFSPQWHGVALDVERGLATETPPRILLWDTLEELAADGTLVAVDEKTLDLEGYPDIQPWTRAP